MLVVATSKWMLYRLQTKGGSVNVGVVPIYLREGLGRGLDQEAYTYESSPKSPT